MQEPCRSIGKAEKEAAQFLNRELDEHLLLTESAYNLIGMTISSIPEQAVENLTSSLKVAIALIIRLSNDLRGVTLLSMMGYPTQATSLVASMYEAAYTVAYIAENDELADKWIAHDDPTRFFENIRTITIKGLTNLNADNPDKQAKNEYKVYRQLCMAKHVNPLYQMQHGLQIVDRDIVGINGPDTSEPAVRTAWFSLQHAVGLVFVAIHSFILNHVPSESRTILVEELNKIIKDHNRLDDAAKKRWGTEDPFLGLWRD